MGDFITRVDSRDVERESMAVLKELILGPQGTQVGQVQDMQRVIVAAASCVWHIPLALAVAVTCTLQVALTFGRRSEEGIEYYEVRLMRGTAEYVPAPNNTAAFVH